MSENRFRAGVRPTGFQIQKGWKYKDNSKLENACDYMTISYSFDAGKWHTQGTYLACM